MDDPVVFILSRKVTPRQMNLYAFPRPSPRDTTFACRTLIRRLKRGLNQGLSVAVVKHVTQLLGHRNSIKAVDCDEDVAVTASKDQTMKIWRFNNVRPVGPVGPGAPTCSQSELTVELGGSPSCLHLRYPRVAVGVKLGREPRHLVRLYDVSTGTCLRVMYGHESRVTSLKMYPRTRAHSFRRRTGLRLGLEPVQRQRAAVQRGPDRPLPCRRHGLVAADRIHRV